ncbi:phage-like baseplate assembly-like protein [Haemophilus pittmaniae HK 85]|uniref:Phage-like baseplate assembly-like protein n=1 Tax=Haemophilus pittmaniae HK 85 TaxID=1035188 RepID=F9Q9T0_9PAST|nr:phage-like baseplate assembly-like protein [Haemophilus pittmaniae HK 85]
MSADNNRRIESIIRFGLIAEVDYAQAKARVKCGEILTDFIPFITLRAGTTKHGHRQHKANNASSWRQVVN